MATQGRSRRSRCRTVVRTAGWLGRRFLAELEATLQRIAVFPGSGSTRHADLAAQLPVPLRFMLVPGFERYLVYYLDLPDRVDIMRVWCVDRGLDALMQDIS
ncbi:type II toxin-antitoxin system RelE/ParE family toxin [Stenotrophomonas maltophilia]|uniref:type II toxin-antitoxin system RelE/ParE family toxin n=1 Tax=Stenotrophomonas maltophilia TaxID=40324 RepID=UPI001FA818D5|nr:type II toxin-antitoxin system RelE/ParE family toxin [Stenotrophomonas maltophilia]